MNWTALKEFHLEAPSKTFFLYCMARLSLLGGSNKSLMSLPTGLPLMKVMMMRMPNGGMGCPWGLQTITTAEAGPHSQQVFRDQNFFLAHF